MFVVTFYSSATGLVRRYSAVPDMATAERAAQSLGLAWIEGRPPTDGPCQVRAGVIEPVPPTLDDLRRERQAAIDAEVAHRAALLAAGYPEAERASWPRQEAEALAWHADGTAPTPYIDAIAAARGVAPEVLRGKVLAKALAYRAASAALVGTRQALRDALAAATTPEAVLAVAWPAPSLPPTPVQESS